MQINKKTAIMIMIFSSFVTFSCTASTFEGIMCNLMGGEWIKDIDAPIGYENYCINKQFNPITPNEEEAAQGETTQPEDTGGVQIFTGTTTLPDLWEDSYSSGQTIDNTIVIRIDQNGALTGTITFNWQGDPSSPLEWEDSPGGPIHSCTTEIVVAITGTLTGTLSDINNNIRVELNQFQDIKRYDCPSSNEIFQGTDIWDAEITINGDSLTGSIPGFFLFEAFRQ